MVWYPHAWGEQGVVPLPSTPRSVGPTMRIAALLITDMMMIGVLGTDQSVLLNFFNNLDDRGSLDWDTTRLLCFQQGVYCDSSYSVQKL